jgi:hypothetical protein
MSYMDSSSMQSFHFYGERVRLLTYIRPHIALFFRCSAIMGYSRVDSLLLCRVLYTWTLSGFANAGSTCSPLFGLLCNRG